MKINKSHLRKYVNLFYILAFIFVLVYIFLKKSSDNFHSGYFAVGLSIGLIIIVGEFLLSRK